MEELTLEKFEEASEFTEDATAETKLVYSEYFSTRTGNKVSFEPGNMQHTGTYKMRGTYYKIYTLTEEEESKGLTTASAGNHVQGMAYAAKLADAKATVVIPTITPLIKVSHIKSYGTDVVLEGDVFDEACDHTHKLTNEFGHTSVYPSGDLDVATGQGTTAMEIIKELPIVDYILILVGGNGLCTNAFTLARLLSPKIKIVDVEPVDINCAQAFLKEGRVMELSQANTIMDGTVMKRPGGKLSSHIQENVDGIITIGDSELIVAFLNMVENYKMTMESSGLLTIAALKHPNIQKEKTVPILSGGNMDVITMSSTVQHGLIERDRAFTTSMLLLNKPGELARVSVLLAKEQDNIVRLEHNQFISINRNAAAELCITMEAFETNHKNQIVSALTSVGYRPRLVKFKGTYSEM